MHTGRTEFRFGFICCRANNHLPSLGRRFHSAQNTQNKSINHRGHSKRSHPGDTMQYIVVSSTVTQHGFSARGAHGRSRDSQPLGCETTWTLAPERVFQLELCITKYAIYLCSYLSGKANISTPLYVRFVRESHREIPNIKSRCFRFP